MHTVNLIPFSVLSADHNGTYGFPWGTRYATNCYQD